MNAALYAIIATAFAAGLLVAWIAIRLTRAGTRADESGTTQPPVVNPSDDRFDALVRALPLGVVMLDRNLRVRFANRAAAAIFGFDRRRVRGSHLIVAVPSIDLEKRAQAALHGERVNAPMTVSGKTVNRTYAVSVYPLLAQDDDDDEAPMREAGGVLVVAEDHTELLALERARQEFLSNVSHELRTPLSSIKLMLETVNEGADEEARRIFLPQVMAQVDRLTALVARLLEQARAESGKLVLEMQEVDVEDVARPIVASFRPQASSAGINLELRPLRPAVIEADRDRLAQIFVNLIDNAMRYTPQGGSVTVSVDVDGGCAVIKVADTGVGIPFKDLPYIFERFYVVERSRTRDSVAGSGAGLGLSIVKTIAEAHRGSVEVDSNLTRGTTFTVRLPVFSLAS